MSRYRKVFVGLAVLAVGAILTAWYRRPVREARLIGLDWRATTEQSRCVQRPRELWCTTDWPPSHGPRDYTTLQLDPIRRSAVRFTRVWAAADSVRWHQLVDSVRSSLAERHAGPLPCDTDETRFPIAQAWDVGAGEARLYAGRIIASPYHPQYWYVSVQLVPHASAGCGPTWRYVRLTPAQELRRVEDWLAQQFGF